MLAFLRRRRSSLSSVSFCDSCGQVCTAACRADAHRDRARRIVLGHGILR
jgi:hypothetical protein